MQTPTILVVDDEQLIRWSLKDRLSDEGLPRHRGRYGGAAVARSEEGVDLVLLDYKLPDGDGLSGAQEDQGARSRHRSSSC